MGVGWGPRGYRLLNGIFCIYKPSGVPCFKVLETIQGNLAKDLNALPCYTYESLKHDEETKTLVLSTADTTSPSLQNHRLVLGDRYIPSDFDLRYVDNLCRHSSGVLVMGIGKKSQYLKKIAAARYLKVYHVQGTFGVATSNYSPKGNVLYRTTYHHITKLLLDKVCAAAQSNHQKHMFEYAGVHPESQKAYELAKVGIVRPKNKDTPPMLYGIKCIDFNLPDFTLEIHSINEKPDYLRGLIHDIGLKLKSTAVCSSVRRIRHGYFTLDHCLTRADWHLDKILSNIQLNKQLLTDNKLLTSRSVKQIQCSYDSKLLTGSKDELCNSSKLLADGVTVNADNYSKSPIKSCSEIFDNGELLANNKDKDLAHDKFVHGSNSEWVTDNNGELMSDNNTKVSDKHGDLINNSKDKTAIFNPSCEDFDDVDELNNDSNKIKHRKKSVFYDIFNPG